MKKTLFKWQIYDLIFVSVAGTLLHFAYDWSNQSPFLAPFSAVNESIWEHMKLFFFPSFIFALAENQFIKKDNFWRVKFLGIMTGVILIPVLYYTYTGILGKSADWFNIAIFFISAIVTFFIETRLLSKENSTCFYPLCAFAVLCLLVLIFIILTYIPPQIPLFQDPITGCYGVN